MHKRYLFIGFFMLSMLAIAGVRVQDDGYIDSILKHRKDKDKEFKDPETTPFKKNKDRKSFKGLHYYPVNPDYKVQATYKRVYHEFSFQQPTSAGTFKEYIKYAELEFRLSGETYKLNLYQSISLSKQEEYKDYLFLPFTDDTNGKATYGGGRYIDMQIPSIDLVTLDFNLAYNPFCAYSEGWFCTIPPKENNLQTAIEAGEKSYFE